MNENESNDVFQRFGGRKFLLSLIGMVALIIMASLNPMNLTTEVIVGVLGVIATYSGSNSMLTAIMAKRGVTNTETAAASSQIQTQPEMQSQVEIQAPQQIPLESRVVALEEAMNSFIEILKVQNETLNRLTISQNQSNLNVTNTRGLDGKNNS